ncbi:zinc ribbon domain-containing protein [Clostridium grantii]|uniref:Zinc-ribbon domain-containing protein n=1 Tax=Clostridium grantii DSM 8605 TaxID=1121316 RepID=A0A1M5VQK6_9CLOT|nr:zinc ribbon domain-containing protein [Clostridium grantii]SHH77470.1 hypothetical protein SAMN02745207_02441 [Clostridium grantii DSM 8605]
MLKDDLVDELVKKCNKCGDENSKESRFCKSCGDNLEKYNSKDYNDDSYISEKSIEDTQPISLIEIEKELGKKKNFKKIKFPVITFPTFKIPKVNLKLPKVSFKLANNKKKIVVLTLILLICFSLVAYAYSTPGTKMILNYYGQNQKSDKLISYIENNKKNVNKKELVSYGINELLTNNLSNGINFLNEEIYNEENSVNFVSEIISQMKNSKVLPDDSIKFSSYYINNYILVENGDLNVEFWNEYIELMKEYPIDDIKSGFYSNIANYYLDNKLEETIKILTAMNSIKIGVENENTSLIELIEKIIDNNSAVLDSTSRTEKIGEDIKSNLNEIESQNTLLSQVSSEIEKTNSENILLNERLSVIQNYSDLRYYCVAKQSSGVYEIILPKNSIFFGEILSNTHAIIYTNDSSLTVNSWGNLDVYDNGYETVTLGTYGKVKQDLMTYKEVSKKDFAEIKNVLESVDKNNATVATLKENSATYKKTIKEFEDANIALEEEKNNLLATIESLKSNDISNDLEIKNIMKIK